MMKKLLLAAAVAAVGFISLNSMLPTFAQGKAETKKEAKLEQTKAVQPVKVEQKQRKNYKNGEQYLAKYANQEQVRKIILIEQSAAEKNAAVLYMLEKTQANDWQELLSCEAFLGKNGIGKEREGDIRTPSGDYGITKAFGIKDNPGCALPYTKVTATMYCCGDKEYYNQFIDTSKVKHTCTSASEHLIDYVPQYNYCLFLDYNKEGVYGKGSAIFLHCKGNYRYTMGCIGVAEDKMVQIMQKVDANTRICIYPY